MDADVDGWMDGQMDGFTRLRLTHCSNGWAIFSNPRARALRGLLQVPDVPRLVHKYAGSESEMLATLKRKYRLNENSPLVGAVAKGAFTRMRLLGPHAPTTTTTTTTTPLTPHHQQQQQQQQQRGLPILAASKLLCESLRSQRALLA